jgi:hypothetical protein
MVNHLSYDQVKFHPHSYADPDGRLFWFDGVLHRAISQEKTPFFARLFEDGTLADLMNHRILVRSELTDLALDGYGMVLRHTVVPFVSYPNEWCATMFKDAALTYLDLLQQLIQRGLTIKDTHPWNFLFDGAQPAYVDLTSITELTDEAHCPNYDKFCRYYIYPLLLMSRGQERIVRYLLLDYKGVLPSDFLTMSRSITSSATRLAGALKSGLKRRLPSRYRELLRRASSTESIPRTKREMAARLENVARIRREIERITFPAIPQLPDDLSSEIQQHLPRVISRLAPASILAIGAKTHWYSSLAVQSNARVVVFDADSAYITQLYYEARAGKLQVLPLVIDFTDPTPSRGLSSHMAIAAADRFQCDLVLAVSMVNPLIRERHLRLDQIVEGLARFSKRWLIIDYNPADKLRPLSEYTLDDLNRSLRKQFYHVSKLQISPENHNLLLCEK